jgi:hypothetical protein
MYRKGGVSEGARHIMGAVQQQHACTLRIDRKETCNEEFIVSYAPLTRLSLHFHTVIRAVASSCSSGSPSA